MTIHPLRPLLAFITAMCIYARSVQAAELGCSTYGVCSYAPDGISKYKPCVNFTQPVPLPDSEALILLKETCPSYYSPDNHALCCNIDNLKVLNWGMQLPRQFFARCPSCMKNFIDLWCAQACDPNQASFINPLPTLSDSFDEFRRKKRTFEVSTELPFDDEVQKPSVAVAVTTEDGIHVLNGTVVEHVDFYVDHSYVDEILTSCRAVQFSGASTKAISMMCGGVENCTVNAFLNFMGDMAANPYLPYPINFISTPSGKYKPLRRHVVPCTQAVNNESQACSCADCAQACSSQEYCSHRQEDPCTFLGIDCHLFLAFLIFSGFSLVLLVMTVFQLIFDTTSSINYASSNEDMAYKGAPGTFDESKISMRERLGHYLESRTQHFCIKWGRFCYRQPIAVFLFGLLLSLCCSIGIFWLRFTTDPVELWSAPGSRARIEKAHFDENFGPFYRTEQMILTPINKRPIQKFTDANAIEPDVVGPVFAKAFLLEALRLQNALSNLTAIDDDGEAVRLTDICYMPLYPDKKECTIMSPLEWFQHDEALLNRTAHMHDEFGMPFEINYYHHIVSCLSNPAQPIDTTPLRQSCLAAFGGPAQPYVVLGGYDRNDAKENDYLNANAIVMTFIVKNSNNHSQIAKASAWEDMFISYLHEYKSSELEITFMTERSIQDEISRQSNADILTIVLSYILMFAYIAFALGQYNLDDNNLCSLLVNSKFMLGLAGVCIVALSVTSSIGVYAWCGIPATMIILEVQPFLVLAVGVDNIFIFVQAYQRDKCSVGEPLEIRIGRICGEVIPSMLLTTLSEIFCFCLGALSDMPAVKVFSLYAGMAIAFDFFLQVTAFLALLTYDLRRQEDGRMEFCCCVKRKATERENEGSMLYCFKKYYSPILLQTYTRIGVLVVFIGWMCSSIAVLNRIELGLDAKLSVPQDSYVLRHFNNMHKYLSVGPPVYFVVKNYPFDKTREQNLLCGSAGCNAASLSAQLNLASHFKRSSYIAQPEMNWVDDFFDWMNPTSSCCQLNPDGTFCPSSDSGCLACNISMPGGRPSHDDFHHYLPMFLKDNPSRKCAKGGHAAYASALHINDNGQVDTSHFMTYHTIMKNSDDFISAQREARAISDNITHTLRLTHPQAQVYPYSVFYLFYEQYETLGREAFMQIMISLGGIFLVTTFIMGFDYWSAAMIIITITLIVINLFGLMFWWSIDFNAISLVNIVMAIGISVEFCSHLTRQFALSIQNSRVDRAKHSLAQMGSSVLSGITMTKFGGIVVLAFAKSQIFQVYYFRMYLGIVLIGAAHGLIFLPVLLSFLGPPVNKRKLLAWMKAETDQMVHDEQAASLCSRRPSTASGGRQVEAPLSLLKSSESEEKQSLVNEVNDNHNVVHL